MKKGILALALAGAIALGGLSATALGGQSAKAASDVKVGLVTDIGGLNDRSFNFLANKGLEEAKAKYGVADDRAAVLSPTRTTSRTSSGSSRRATT